MTIIEKADVEKRIAKSLASLPPERKVYFNGFALTISASDVLISLETNGEPTLLLNASLSVAKSLVEMLGGILAKFEKDFEYKIPALQEVEKKVEKVNVETK